MIRHRGLMLGDLFASDTGTKYKMIQHLGAGGNCDVYLVLALNGSHQGALFALKIFGNCGNSERVHQFKEEGEFLKSVTHPAIMKVYDSGDVPIPGDKGKSIHPFIVADYYPETLEKVLTRGIRLPEKVLYAMQLLSALKFLTNLDPPVVHRDIKPQNIFIRGLTCALGDFGLMKKLDNVDEEGDVCALLKGSKGAGMPKGYRTPDLIQYAKKAGPITVQSDVYQLGLVLAEMFCGTNPQKRAEKVLDEIKLEQLPVILGKHGNSINVLIRRMLVDDPKKRETVEDLLDPWEGVLNNVAKDFQDLEGRAF